jgi:hypothetical protein
MKILSKAIALLSCVIIFSGCGKDGKSGSASIAVDWDWYVDAYNDNNPDIPSTISKNFDYHTKPGVYDCEYACSDGDGNEWYWEYQYKITVNAGKAGKGFKDGADGTQRRHQLFLNGLSEATFYVKGTANPGKKAKKQLPAFTYKAGLTKTYHGEAVLDEYFENGYRITVKRRMFTLD